MYRCEATSIAGFLQQLAVAYIAHGYWFYVPGLIPPHKDPRQVDQKLIDRYGLEISKWTRCRQRKLGRAAVQYLRHDHFFVLVATHGEHKFFAAEAGRIQDFRRRPLHFAGYTIACRRFRNQWHAAVCLDRELFDRLKNRFASLSSQRDALEVEQEFLKLRFEPYAAVRRQLLQILRTVNTARRRAGAELVAKSVLQLFRKSILATCTKTEPESEGGGKRAIRR